MNRYAFQYQPMNRLEWQPLAKVGDRVKMANPQYMEIVEGFSDEYCNGWQYLRGTLVEIEDAGDWSYERVQWDGDGVTRHYPRGLTTNE